MSMVAAPRHFRAFRSECRNQGPISEGALGGEKVVLRYPGGDPVIEQIVRHYARTTSANTLKYLAIFVLVKACGWRMEDVGTAFGHPKGHISRIVDTVANELRDQFDLAEDT